MVNSVRMGKKCLFYESLNGNAPNGLRLKNNQVANRFASELIFHSDLKLLSRAGQCLRGGDEPKQTCRENVPA